MTKCLDLALFRGTIAQGCWCIRISSYTRHLQTNWRRWDLWSISVSEIRTVTCCTSLMRTEVRVCQSSAQRASQHQTANIGEWRSSSWNERSYYISVVCVKGKCCLKYGWTTMSTIFDGIAKYPRSSDGESWLCHLCTEGLNWCFNRSYTCRSTVHTLRARAYRRLWGKSQFSCFFGRLVTSARSTMCLLQKMK